MNQFFRIEIILLLLIFSINSVGRQSCTTPLSNGKMVSNTPLQSGKSEFRAIWIATINNIDWPSKPNLTVAQQKNEFLELLDKIQKFNLNVVILQVRAASDAFYDSKIEPWSLFLTGKQGRAPKPFYDPLAWAIMMCHQRGMELHAWFNPFRVRNIGYYPLDPNSFAAKHPQYVKEFDKKSFLDPGYPEVRSHVINVIAEVANNYDVDAILLDDYFYPYPVNGKKFGDDKSFAKYGKEYYPKRLKEWRRENINQFVSSLHDTLQIINPKIKFGISPFGIWRNKTADPEGSVGLRGISSYDDLFADVRKWLKNGWIDYVIPQLYWEKGNHFGDFTSLVKWWSENSYGKSLYIGQALFKSTAAKNRWNQPEELNEQINFLRTNDKVRGFAFYSASNLSGLSSAQIKTLCDNQLNTTAAIDDDRHLTASVESAVAPVKTLPIAIVPNDDLIKTEFLNSLDYNPISIRQSWASLSPVRPSLKKQNGYRLLSWKVTDQQSDQLIALVTFTKTGKNRFRQNVLEFSKTGDFNISDQKWKELRKMELLLVVRDLNSKSETNSNFFQLKRRKVKELPNPFKH